MRILLAVTAAFLVVVTAAGQGIINPFDIGLGVRSMGLGGAYTALAEGTEALLYNPAGLSHQQGVHASSSYIGAMGLYGVGWLAGAAPSLGAGLAYLSMGEIYDPEDGTLAYSQFGFVAGGGIDLARTPLPLPFPASVGANLKLCSTRMHDESAMGLAIDLAGQARFPAPFGEIGAGFAIRELGFGLGIGEEGGGWTTEFAAGASVTLPIGVFGAVELCSRYTALGVGWRPIDLVEVRGGIQLSGNVTRWTLGLGVAWEEFALDYALMTHPLGTSHRLGFGIDVGTLLGL